MASGQGFAPGRHKIDDYGGGGFRFADMSHRGTILATPSGVRALDLDSARDIDEETLDLVLGDPAGRPDLLLIGTGSELAPLSAPLRAKLRAAGIGCEIMATRTAVGAYNLLVDENRRVAALLIAV